MYFILVICQAADGLICSETKNNTFKKDIPCKWTYVFIIIFSKFINEVCQIKWLNLLFWKYIVITDITYL